MNRPAPSRRAKADQAPRRRTDGAGKALLICVLLGAAVLAAGRWRASALAARADAAEASRVAVAEPAPSPESAAGAEPRAERAHDSSRRFRLDAHLSAVLDSVAGERDTELVVCLLDADTMVVPRQSVVAPLGVRLEEDCPSDSFALWHNHPASATAPHAACSLSTMDVGLVLRMRPRWAIVQAQRGERCWWSYGQVVQHSLISRELLAPADTQREATLRP